MKKIKSIAVLLAVIMAACGMFASCSSSKEPTEITTDNAVIKNADSIALIKTYSTEELGLPGSWDDYNFVANKSGGGVKISKGEYKGYYVKVAVGNKTENEDGTSSIDIAKAYYINYDGTVILTENEDGTFSPLASVHAVPSSEPAAAE